MRLAAHAWKRHLKAIAEEVERELRGKGQRARVKG
jgi:hypothetical protein